MGEQAHTVEDWGNPEYLDGAQMQFALADGEGRRTAYVARRDRADLYAAAPALLEALVAVHAPYATLTEEALEAGVLMEFGPPKPEKGAALLRARAAIQRATGGE